MRKRYFTLLELLIAIALTSIILTSLTFFYREIVVINTKADQLQAENFQRRLLASRLSAAIPKAISEKDKRKDFFFFTPTDSRSLFFPGTENLIFSYDNGVDLDKEFSGNVLGRLLVDTEGNLILATWPIPRRWKEGGLPPMKKQILMEGVDGLKFSFFIPPEEEVKKPIQPQEIFKGKKKVEPMPKGGWTNRWYHAYKELPAIVKIEVKSGDKKWTFAYPLPNATTPITITR